MSNGADLCSAMGGGGPKISHFLPKLQLGSWGKALKVNQKVSFIVITIFRIYTFLQFVSIFSNQRVIIYEGMSSNYWGDISPGPGPPGSAPLEMLLCCRITISYIISIRLLLD